MVPQSGISLQTPIDHQNNSFVQYNAAMRSMASASETIDADDFMKEFNFLQGKEEPNSNDVLAKAMSLSGINGSDISGHRQDILAFGISCMNPQPSLSRGYFDHFVTSCVAQIQFKFLNFFLVLVIKGTHVTKFRERWERGDSSFLSNNASKSVREG